MRGKLNSVDLLGLMYGGAIDAHLAAGEGMQRATVSFEDIQLQRYPGTAALLQLQEGMLGGKLSGVITVEKHGNEDGETRAAAELDLDHVSLVDAKLANGISLPPLHFDKAAHQAEPAERPPRSAGVRRRRSRAQGGAERPDRHARAAQESVLNLKLSAVPGENSPDEMKTLLSFLPPPPKGAKPDTPHTISGTLARPRVR